MHWCCGPTQTTIPDDLFFVFEKARRKTTMIATQSPVDQPTHVKGRPDPNALLWNLSHRFLSSSITCDAKSTRLITHCLAPSLDVIFRPARSLPFSSQTTSLKGWPPTPTHTPRHKEQGRKE